MSGIELLSKEQLSTIPDLYQTDGTDAQCLFKLFTPDSCFSWYLIEFSHQDMDTCFGLVKGLETELGYFSLSELSNVKGPLGLNIELDSSFKPTKLSIMKKENK